jgi:hypothetical protein
VKEMRWAGHVERMAEKRNIYIYIYIGYRWESQKERDHWEDQDVVWWPILKWILER